MKVIFKKEDLVKALDIVQRAAQNKVTSNTNNGIYIKAAGSTAEFQANDYSISIKTSCSASVEEEGDIVTASPQLPVMIRLLPGSEVIMEQKKGEGFVTFRSERAVYHFPIRNPDDFPMVEVMENADGASVKAKVLSEMVNLTQYAAATDRQKPFFTGILFEIRGNSFAMAATNTHRLAAKESTLEEDATAPGRMIVPAQVMTEVVRMFPQGEDDVVRMTWAKSHIAFTFGDTYFISTLISGEYPDYHRVIPQRFDTTAVLNLKAFRDAVSMVAPISRDMSYKTINFNFSDGMLDIYEEDKAIGSSRTSIPAQIEGDPIHIVFNCFYVEDILKHSGGETVTLHLMKNGPMLVEQEEDKTYQYVVTPMRGR